MMTRSKTFNGDKVSRPKRPKYTDFSSSEESDEIINKKHIKKASKSSYADAKPPKQQKNIIPSHSDDDNEIVETELERIRKENIAERKRLFAELNLKEAVDDFAVFLTSTPKANKKQKVGPYKTPWEGLPLRPKSLRIQGIKENKIYAEYPDSRENTSFQTVATKFCERHIDEHLAMKDVLYDHFTPEESAQVVEECCNNLKLSDIVKREDEDSFCLQSSNLKEFILRLKSLRINDSKKIRVIPNRAFSVTFHPSSNLILLAAGGKTGAVGLWNATGNENIDEAKVITYVPHTAPVSCLSFSNYNHEKLYSTSYDGTVRTGDLYKQQFDLIYCTPDDEYRNHVTWHVELSPGVLLLANGSGHVSKVDTREKKVTEYHCHTRSVRMISLHPSTQQHIVTASSHGAEIALWDLRKLKAKDNESCCLWSIKLQKSPSAAFFSPVTGNKLLTTSYDDLIRVFDTSDLSNITLKHSVPHNNFTGRWLTPFKAVWHPQREDVFMVGSMNKAQRIIEIFQSNGSKLLNLQDSQHLNTVQSLVAFHPTVPAVVGANSSGYLHLFK